MAYDYIGCARAGAQILDVWRPGWACEIDPDKLLMGSSGLCILGRLYGCYEHGVQALGLNNGKAFQRGFTIPHDVRASDPECFVKLTDAWRQIIMERKGS